MSIAFSPSVPRTTGSWYSLPSRMSRASLGRSCPLRVSGLRHVCPLECINIRAMEKVNGLTAPQALLVHGSKEGQHVAGPDDCRQGAPGSRAGDVVQAVEHDLGGIDPSVGHAGSGYPQCDRGNRVRGISWKNREAPGLQCFRQGRGERVLLHAGLDQVERQVRDLDVDLCDSLEVHGLVECEGGRRGGQEHHGQIPAFHTSPCRRTKDTVGGMDLCFRDLGGDGGPVVILHGLFGSSQNWAGMGRRLSPRRSRVCAGPAKPRRFAPRADAFAGRLHPGYRGLVRCTGGGAASPHRALHGRAGGHGIRPAAPRADGRRGLHRHCPEALSLGARRGACRR